MFDEGAQSVLKSIKMRKINCIKFVIHGCMFDIYFNQRLANIRSLYSIRKRVGMFVIYKGSTGNNFG